MSRAALAWSVETARLARQHNDANVVAIGARMHPAEGAVAFAETFLSTPFSGDERHGRRIRMLSDYESSGVLPPLPESASGSVVRRLLTAARLGIGRPRAGHVPGPHRAGDTDHRRRRRTAATRSLVDSHGDDHA